jgi:urease accessory protein
VTPTNAPARPTRIECELVGGRARFSVLDQGTYLAPRPVHATSPGNAQVHLRVALIGISMMLLGHDDVVVDVRVGPGVVLEIVEPAGLVAYDAGGEPSRWTLRADVGEGGALLWDGAPFVAAAGSAVTRRTDVTLAPDACVLLREILVLGRSGEEGGRLRNVTHLHDAAAEYLVEDLDLTGSSRRAVGVLGASKVMASVTAAGWRPSAVVALSSGTAASAGVTLQLAREGTVQRALAMAAHEVDASLAVTYSAWKEDLLERTSLSRGSSASA